MAMNQGSGQDILARGRGLCHVFVGWMYGAVVGRRETPKAIRPSTQEEVEPPVD